MLLNVIVDDKKGYIRDDFPRAAGACIGKCRHHARVAGMLRRKGQNSGQLLCRMVFLQTPASVDLKVKKTGADPGCNRRNSGSFAAT